MVARGGMLKLRFDWYITTSEVTFVWSEVTPIMERTEFWLGRSDRITLPLPQIRNPDQGEDKIDQDFMQRYSRPPTYPKYSWVISQPPAWAAGDVCSKNKTFTRKTNCVQSLPCRNYTSTLCCFVVVQPRLTPVDPSRPSFPYAILKVKNDHIQPADQL